MKKIYLILFLIFLFQNINAQETVVKSINEKTLWSSFDMGGGLYLFEDDGYGDKSDDAFRDTWCFRAKVGYYITPRVSLGLGIGEIGGEKKLPIFFDFRYLLARRWYTYGDIGGAIRNGAAEKSGFMTELGIGYRLPWGKRFAFNFATGYNLMSYRTNTFIETTRWRNTFLIRLGFEI